ncbi:hypothetical protein ZHAS_00016131 [Anopheles sinensis]|uniref:Uncharacterized protein n=1 Tax=Anopheles sinensis TaxID=74873 RepID=A0A084WCS0_ANOSI|nr:hypothetical protein ZHAS_00016131 [Anopheles sinensis]
MAKGVAHGVPRLLALGEWRFGPGASLDESSVTFYDPPRSRKPNNHGGAHTVELLNHGPFSKDLHRLISSSVGRTILVPGPAGDCRAV